MLDMDAVYRDRDPEQTLAEVRRRIVQHNTEPSAATLTLRVRAVGAAARAGDTAALRGALDDLAAIAVRLSAHRDPLRVLGIAPRPVRW